MNAWSAQETGSGLDATGREALTALIVDDEGHVRSYLRVLLRTLGVVTVWEAANGAEAVVLFQRHRPSVVFLDVNMPIMSGAEAIQKMTAFDPDASVVMVTSQNDLETVKVFLQLGAIGYVLKYLTREEVSRMIAGVLDRVMSQLPAAVEPSP